MGKKILLLLTLVALPLCAEIKFIVDGAANNAFIVTDLDPVPVAQYAARELAEYLEKITGATLLNEIGTADRFSAIVVGYGPVAQRNGLTLDGLKPDGFRIVTKGKNLFIYGVDRPTNRPVLGGVHHMAKIHSYSHRYDISAFGESGTLHGVYYFLREYLGVRWFMPGEIGEVCPKMKDITIPDIDITVNPDFEYRVPFVGLFNYNHDYVKWFHRLGFGAPKCVEINHSFYLMNKYQKEHPEWFALLKDGRRDFNVTCEGRGNLCLSNPELLQAFIYEGREYFKAHPEQDIFCVMPNDWFNQICECPKCQAQAEYDKPEYGKFSNYVWNFVNEVAKELKKSNPDKWVGCCAYNSYMMIPDKVELEDNICVMQCKCLYYRFDDFYKWRNDELAYDWARKVKRFYIWDYYCWNSTNSHLTGLPIIFSKWLETDVRNMKGNTRGYYFDCGVIPPRYQFASPEMNSITHYLTGRLLWNTDLNAADMMEDFVDKFYGPAYAPMKQFWARAGELWCNMDVKKRGAADQLSRTLYTPEVLNELKGYLEEGQSLVEPDSMYSKRIACLQRVFMGYASKVLNAKTEIPVTTVAEAESVPVIDGKMDECWNKAEVLKLVDQYSGSETKITTTARILHDRDNVYVFVDCAEPKMKNITARCTKNDDTKAQVWTDDAIELFIAPDYRVPSRCVQIVANSNGYWWDAAKGTRQFKAGTESEYNSGMTVKAAKREDGWSLEFAIPKAGLTLDGTPAIDQWRMNICRDRNVAGIDTTELECICWSPVLSMFWYTPDRFGYVKF